LVRTHNETLEILRNIRVEWEKQKGQS
jgi:hypothetical protein